MYILCEGAEVPEVPDHDVVFWFPEFGAWRSPFEAVKWPGLAFRSHVVLLTLAGLPLCPGMGDAIQTLEEAWAAPEEHRVCIVPPKKTMKDVDFLLQCANPWGVSRNHDEGPSQPGPSVPKTARVKERVAKERTERTPVVRTSYWARTQ